MTASGAQGDRCKAVAPGSGARLPASVCSASSPRHTCAMIDLDDSAPDDVGALLGADGPFAHEVPNFAPREAQQAMARAVQQAIAGRETLIAEAA